MDASLRLDRIMKTMHFANYTDLPDSARTTETTFFPLLREAREFMEGKYGYIISVREGGFMKIRGLNMPLSAAEHQRITQCSIRWDAKIERKLVPGY
jgi:hypothetical protein